MNGRRNLLRAGSCAGALLVVVSVPSMALAGMPAVVLHELAKQRLEVISFFLLGILVSAAVVFAAWNGLRRDLAWLPRLSYGKACGLVVLWGLLFVVVLTMISGARELMTPGAWERNGATYKLKETRKSVEISRPDLGDRQAQLGRLNQALMDFAASHEGRFPTKDELDKLPTECLLIPDQSGLRYVYLPGRTRQDEPALLAYEPTVYGDDPLALLTSGAIRPMPFDEIHRLRSDETPR